MIDKIDEHIIKLLAKNGRIKLSDLAKQVNLSISPCQARLKKLEKKKYILGYHARINYEQIQKSHVAFVQVVLSDTRATALENFNAVIKNNKFQKIYFNSFFIIMFIFNISITKYSIC